MRLFFYHNLSSELLSEHMIWDGRNVDRFCVNIKLRKDEG